MIQSSLGALIVTQATIADAPSVCAMRGARTEPAGYIHMLMVSRECAGHGVGRAVFELADESALYEKELQLAFGR